MDWPDFYSKYRPTVTHLFDVEREGKTMTDRDYVVHAVNNQSASRESVLRQYTLRSLKNEARNIDDPHR